MKMTLRTLKPRNALVALARFRHAGSHQAGKRAVMAAPPHDRHLGFVLRDMKEDPGAGPLGLAGAFLQKFVGTGVEGMRRATGEDAATGAASFVTALGLSDAGLEQAKTSKSAAKTVTARLERNIDISPPDRSFNCGG